LLSEHFFSLSQGAGTTTQALLESSSRFNTTASIVLVSFTLLALGAALLGGNGISKRLLSVASVLREGANQVTSAGGQVATSSQSLAHGANEQAASLEETSSSLEE